MQIEEKDILSHWKPQSIFCPTWQTCPPVEVYLKLVMEDFKKIKTKMDDANLTRPELTAIKELQAMRDIVIKPSDKGGNIVIWPEVMYEKEAYKQLKNTVCYTEIASDPTIRYKAEIDRILRSAVLDEYITDCNCQALTLKFPRVPTFYLLPKVHKNPTHPPGRPIVSSIGGLCEPICQFIDSFLQLSVETLPSYIRDTMDVLARLAHITVDDNTLLATCNVESLYTCIDHEDGLRATQFYLSMQNVSAGLMDLVLKLLRFILTHNYFIFRNRYYLQKRGTAMGATCAPSYANLFLGWWEREIVFSEDNVEFTQHVLLWLRYIDDVLILWQGTAAGFKGFVDALNHNNMNIKLTFSCSKTQVEFLDLFINLGPDGTLYTDIFRKKTATNAILHASSFHPEHQIKGIPKSEFLRLKRNVSTERGFIERAGEMRERFTQTGYSNRCVEKGYRKALNTPRETLLCPKAKINSDHQIRFIGTYNKQWHQLRQTLQSHWKILMTGPDLKRILGDKITMKSRKSPNLRDKLVTSHFVPTTNETFLSTVKKKGFFKCKNCSACRYMCQTDVFTDFNKTKKFKIKDCLECKSKGVIYCIMCPCGLPYIGMITRELRFRILEHVRNIKNASKDLQAFKKITSVARHFHLTHASDFTLLQAFAIEKVSLGLRGGDLERALLRRESRWIVQMDSMMPRGLNDYLGFSMFL
ncbi:uncharacterized protein LOC142487291 [Ascaphus truei]|uniref:uncharacterized protein LOC142487291 n=1 Tax=Ascaphus truei TaxID=8439 RepID=UPI003F5AA9DF